MTDDLVKRLRELRSEQYADPNTAPEFVFLDPDVPPKEWEKQYAMDVIYVRADRIKELEKQKAYLEAKLARAAKPFASIKIKDGMSQPGEIGRTDVTNIRAALAELTGGKDE